MKKTAAVLALLLTVVLTVGLLAGCSSAEPTAKEIRSVADLSGKKVGVQTGTVFDQIVEKNVPGAKLEYYNTSADLGLALETGKVSAYCMDLPLYRMLSLIYPHHKLLTVLSEETYGYMYSKSAPRSEKLCRQMNDFLAGIRENGTLKQIDGVWFGEDEKSKTVDFSGMTGENGKLTMAITTDVGAPFAYVKNGEYVGYDVDIAARFCRANGYALEVLNVSSSGFINMIATGKCDFGGSCITITEERKESALFSDPNYVGGNVLVVNPKPAVTTGDNFLASIAESFEKTFIREQRWKLFVSGIVVTLLLSLISMVSGTLLGFFVYLPYRFSGRVFCKTIDAVTAFLCKTPVVVILMILYYGIFGSINISGVWVSILGFTLLFGASVIGLLKTSVNTIGPGQTEAALALGYTPRQTFIKIILPQALRHFMPNFKAAVVGLIKDTAVVGYIAVQDLTKVSDIIRSRTYEAFFPLIASAVLYFLVAWLLTKLVSRIEFRTDNKHRKPEKILKGVKPL